MGCISSKHVAKSCISPLHDSSLIILDNGTVSASKRSSDSSSLRNRNRNPNHNRNFGVLENIKEGTKDEDKTSNEDDRGSKRDHVVVDIDGAESLISQSGNKHSKNPAYALSIRIGRSTEAEHVAAGWPAWFSAVAGEAIEGWLPLKSDKFERLEKIGQGTYSSVYRARDLESGKMVALKKVRFDNLQPESVRFMAREIKILRRLDHPNIMKLEGIIMSHLSSSVYLVFEYMEHDLAGLLSCPNIKFSDSQIKCYMQQLLSGIEHCHSKGILHRDIKSSNILVNNEGQLKIADFGLANFFVSRNKQPLTSRVVTLWYRPPELLLGAISYGTYVDMWSMGCVFAELLFGRPILKGRTEMEQLHKIFMFCGSPPDEYWKTSKLPLATMFKPRQAYESTLREKCKELPRTAVNLIETLLSVEPNNRGTATSALESEYFNTKPYACHPSSLPKYPPNKEIDARFREEARRRKACGRLRATGALRNPRRVRKSLQEQAVICKVAPSEDRSIGGGSYYYGARGSGSSKASYDTVLDVSQTTEASQSDTVCKHPAQATAPNGQHGWSTKRQKHVCFVTPTSQDIRTLEPDMPENEESTSRALGHVSSVTDYRSILIQPRRNNGRQEGHTRNGVRRSRFSGDAELL